MTKPTIEELERILNSPEPHAIEIRADGSIVALPAVLEFGTGKFVVDTGTFKGQPAVFIANAAQPGTVGASSAREGHPLDSLQPGERVLTFPTDAQAKAVADALCNSAAAACQGRQADTGIEKERPAMTEGKSERVVRAALCLSEAAHEVIAMQTDLDEVHKRLRDAMIEFDKAHAATQAHVAQ